MGACWAELSETSRNGIRLSEGDVSLTLRKLTWQVTIGNVAFLARLWSSEELSQRWIQTVSSLVSASGVIGALRALTLWAKLLDGRATNHSADIVEDLWADILLWAVSGSVCRQSAADLASWAGIAGLFACGVRVEAIWALELLSSVPGVRIVSHNAGTVDEVRTSVSWAVHAWLALLWSLSS